MAVRRHCALPAGPLGTPRPPTTCGARRARLGWQEVNHRFLRGVRGRGCSCVRTPSATPSHPVTTPAELAAAAGAAACEVVRLERIAESVAHGAQAAGRVRGRARPGPPRRGGRTPSGRGGGEVGRGVPHGVRVEPGAPGRGRGETEAGRRLARADASPTRVLVLAPAVRPPSWGRRQTAHRSFGDADLRL
ncbi:hypothetical protein LT493_01465 [Streptomyces tricolor]|nr:hypothetical protein [Streptomyces tricolor]